MNSIVNLLILLPARILPRGAARHWRPDRG